MKKSHFQNDKKRNRRRKEKRTPRNVGKKPMAAAVVAPVKTTPDPGPVAPEKTTKSNRGKNTAPVAGPEKTSTRKKKVEKPTPVEVPVPLPSMEMFAEAELVAPIKVDDDFRNKRRFIKSVVPMYRAPFGREGGRYYFREGFPDFYASYSLWTKSVLPTNPGLIKWKVDKGAEGEMISLVAREYGSILHLFIARHETLEDPFRFKFNGPDSNEWREHIAAVVSHHGLALKNVETFESQLKNDFLAYFNWKREHNVNVIAIECPLFDDDFKIATPVDMVVSCLVKKSPYAKEATEPAIVGVDFKSGESGVNYDEYMLQLEFIRHAWNKRFSGTKYEMTDIYNWHPKKRNMSNGGYHFVNQSGKFTQEQFIHLAQTCAVMGYNKPTGGLLKYNDGENELDVSVEKVDPYVFLKEFFKK